MGRTENINVFQDTMNMCKDNDRIWESVHNSAEGQKLILEGAAIAEPDKKRYKEKAQITVSKKRTFEAASGYKNENSSTQLCIGFESGWRSGAWCKCSGRVLMQMFRVV
jgi:hypothetical protein